MRRSRSLALPAVSLLLALGSVFLWPRRAGPPTPEVEPAGASEPAGRPEPPELPAPLERAEPGGSRRALVLQAGSAAASVSSLVAGRVVDEHGRPLVCARIELAEFDVAQPGTRTCETDARGRFELPANASGAKWIVRATHPECWNSAQRTVARGEQVELALERGAELRGRLATEGGEALPDLVLELENLETRVKTSAALAFRTAPDEIGARAPHGLVCTAQGVFEAYGLRPGPYSVEVRAIGIARPVARVESIELHGGERWNGLECNPLLLRLPAPVDVALEIGRVPGFPPGERLRLAFDPVPEERAAEGVARGRIPAAGTLPHLASSPDFLARPNGLFVPGETARIQLPSAGRYEVSVFLERVQPGFEAVELPIRAAAPRFLDVPGGARAATLRFELDAAQREALLAILSR